MATSFINLVKVTPVVSQTSSKTGTLVSDRVMGGTSVVEWRADDEGHDREDIQGDEKASTEAPTKRQKVTENFMVFRLLCIQKNTDKGTLDVLYSETAMMVVLSNFRQFQVGCSGQ
jgi:hypothetical protein